MATDKPLEVRLLQCLEDTTAWKGFPIEILCAAKTLGLIDQEWDTPASKPLWSITALGKQRLAEREAWEREQLPLAERVRAEAERSDEEVEAALPSDEGACHWCGREVVLGGPREADNAGSCFTNVDGETRFACTEHYPVMAAWVDEQVEREQASQPKPV